MSRVRIVLAEDQALVLGALGSLLRIEPDFEVVGSALDGKQALDLCLRLRPDVLIADIEMPELSGLDVAKALHEASLPTRIVVVTTFARGGYLRRAMDAGVYGYVLKDLPSDQLAECVRRVHRGVRVIDPQLAAATFGAVDALTDRQRQVLRLAAEGLSGAQIGARLSLSEGTVRNYLSEAISKTGAANRIEAARVARENGWL